MKKNIKKTVSVVMLAGMLALAGCGSKSDSDDNKQTTTESTSTQTTKGYVFETNGTTISVDADMAPIVAALGEPTSYFEAASCAFEGLDKVYTYNGFEINTYPSGDKDLVSSIVLKSDSVTTKEGAYIGMTLDALKGIYSDAEEVNGSVTLEKDGMKLLFIIDGGAVKSIQYLSNNL